MIQTNYRLRNLRTNKGKTQREMAIQIGVSTPTYMNMELQPIENFTLIQLRKMSIILELKLSELIQINENFNKEAYDLLIIQNADLRASNIILAANNKQATYTIALYQNNGIH